MAQDPMLAELPPLEDLEQELETGEPPTTRKTRGPGKPRAATSSTSSAESRSASPRPSPDKRARSLEEIRTGVEDLFIQASVPISPFLPVTGTVLAARSGEAADRLVRLCEQDARVMRAMLRFVKYNAYIGVGMIVSTLVVAVTVDVGAIGADSLLASKMVGKEIELVYSERQRAQAAASVNGATAPAPEWSPAAS